MPRMNFFLKMSLMFLLIPTLASATELVLKSGQKLEGKIVEQTDKYVKFDAGVGVNITYYTDEIDTIDGQKIEAAKVPSLNVRPNPELAQVSPPAEEIQNTISAKHQEGVNNQNIQNQQENSIQSASLGQPTIPQSQPQQWHNSNNTLVQKNNQSFHKNAISPFQAFEMIFALFAGMGLFVVVLFALFHVVFSMPLYFLAKKTSTPYAGLAWVPFVNLYTMCKIGNKAEWWLILLFIPFVNFVVFPYIWCGIAKVRNKPQWLGVLMIIPPINLFVPWYLALSA